MHLLDLKKIPIYAGRQSLDYCDFFLVTFYLVYYVKYIHKFSS